jgi:hypothetical protein
MLNTILLSLALVSQHRTEGHPASMAGHPTGHTGMVGVHSTMHQQVMQDVAQHEAMVQERHHEYALGISRDMPHLQQHFRDMHFDPRHWETMQHHHYRLGVNAFWRLAHRHKDIEQLLRALKEERSQIGNDTLARMARIKAQRETWDILAERRFEGYLRELQFEQRHWETLRYYRHQLGADRFWQLAHEGQDVEKLKLALSADLRQALLVSIDEVTPEPILTPTSPGLIEITPTTTKGKTKLSTKGKTK